MNNTRAILLFSAILLVLIISVQHQVSYAQKDIQRAEPNKTKPTNKPSIRPQPPKLATLQLTNADPTMRIEIDNQQIANKDLKWENDSTLVIKAKPGTRQLKITREGYQPFSRSVEVTPTKIARMPIEMVKQQTSLTVRSLAGTRVSINGKEQGIIATNGKLIIEKLNVGERYKVSLNNDDYQLNEETVLISGDRDNDIDFKLTALPTSAEFFDTFQNGLLYWDAPSQWQVIGKKLLQINGTGIGMPKEKRYCDAHVKFGLKLNNRRGAAWALKAKDPQNYYLFILNGPEGRAPNSFQTFICRNGQYDPDKPAIINIPIPANVPLNPGSSFTVNITMAEGVICHFLTPNDMGGNIPTGEDISIGYFQPPNNTLSCGNVGFTAPNSEDFFVYEFVISPNVKDSCAHQSK